MFSLDLITVLQINIVVLPVTVNRRWRVLIYRMIVKQAKREQTLPVCLPAVEKYEKVESINTKND